MSDTFKYAQYAEGNVDPAQEFLKKKMSNTSSSYTQEQLDRLAQTGGSAVIGATEDTKLTSDFYNDQNPSKKGTSKPSSSKSSGGNFKYNWTAEDFQERLGLGSRENVGENFNAAAGATDSDKTKSNPLLGDGYMSNEDFERLKKDKDFQKLYMEKGGSKAERIKSGDFDWDEMSINHIDGFLDDFGSELKEKKEEKEEPNKPIEYSPEIQQAISRVKSYEDDVMSGKISEEIYGGFSRDRDDSIDNEVTDNVIDINDGQTGIGTEGSLSSDDLSFESTQNFLQSKKLDVLKKYQFKPV